MRLLFLLAALAVSINASAQSLTVFAASSLTEAFADIAERFEASQPGSEVVLNVAGSSTLATQLEQGAPADVFASADWANMLRVVPPDEASVFATNKLVVITPPGSPASSLEALGTASYLLVLADERVPAGHYGLQVLEKLEGLYGPGYSERVLANLVSLETNVRQVAAKVALGEADAAMVYATDAARLGSVTVLDIPDAYNVRAEYPVAALSTSDLALSFLAFVLGPEGQAVLGSYGFSSPQN